MKIIEIEYVREVLVTTRQYENQRVGLRAKAQIQDTEDAMEAYIKLSKAVDSEVAAKLLEVKFGNQNLKAKQARRQELEVLGQYGFGSLE